MQLELLKPEMALAEHEIRSTIVVFVGTKIRERSEAESNLRTAQCCRGRRSRERSVSPCRHTLRATVGEMPLL